jgi:hypothetical protein
VRAIEHQTHSRHTSALASYTVTTHPEHVEFSKRALRERAAAFTIKHADDTSEAAERQIFWNDLFAIFGREVKEVGRFERAAQRLSTGRTGFMDLLVPGDMAVEHKSAGADLDAAMRQLFDYLDDLQPAATPWLVVACDFQQFFWQDLRSGREGRFTLAELPEHVELFWWLAGYGEATEFEDEEQANLVATGYMADLHDAMLASGYDAHALREWLTRILFCLFADDTDVWEPNAFKHHIFLNTRADGSDLGSSLAYLFQLLNTSPAARPTTLDEDLAAFTYINGDLFETTLPIPMCDEVIRNALLAACKFDWSAISPAIFGSMFQNVMTPAERRQLGAHYTTEENILKTIRPLFLDELEAELSRIPVANSAQSRATLNAYHDKLAGLTFLDPACGCGNFLVIAYREIRRLETEVLRKISTASKREGAMVLDVAHLLKVTVGQFYGIEIEEFPARIARTALYLMDHKANRDFSREFGEYFARFPIPSSPHIAIANALRLDWNELLPARECHYIMGNPPFVGSRLATPEQKADQEAIWAGDRHQGKLDFVTNWFKLAAEYSDGHPVRCALVATNSITQGEQPAVLWKELHRHNVHIDFAHSTFAWSSEAKGRAAVHVVIVGFSTGANVGPHPLWVYSDLRGPGEMTLARNINPYLIDGPDIVIESRQKPIAPGVPPMLFGSMPRDNGHLSNITSEEADEIRATDPVAARYLRRFIGASEVVTGKERYCLWLLGADPVDLGHSPVLIERLGAVRAMRLDSKAASTRAMAATPGLFAQLAQPGVRYLAVPRHTSENREYLPTAFYEPDVIAGDSLLTIPGAEVGLFGILSSSMFMAWNRTVSGRLKSDMRISQEVTYNNFPFPAVDDARSRSLSDAAEAVLAARATHDHASLADLYEPLAMPPNLHSAHEQLDRVVDRLFAPRRKFEVDADRLAVLLEHYEALNSPLLASTTGSVRRRKD